MRIAIGTDHAGYTLKQELIQFVQSLGHEVTDCGVDSGDYSVDYPDYAAKVGELVRGGRVDRGILICGSGVGISIAANKMNGIYAAICHDTYSAHQGVEHDKMNVLCLGARVIGVALAHEIVSAFLKAEYHAEPRFERRFDKIVEIETTDHLDGV